MPDDWLLTIVWSHMMKWEILTHLKYWSCSDWRWNSAACKYCIYVINQLGNLLGIWETCSWSAYDILSNTSECGSLGISIFGRGYWPTFAKFRSRKWKIKQKWKKDQYYLLMGWLNGYTNSRGSWKPASGGCGCGCKGKCKWVWECAWYSLVNRIWKLLNIVDSFKRASAAWVGLWSQLAQSDIVVVVSGKCGNMKLSG